MRSSYHPGHVQVSPSLAVLDCAGLSGLAAVLPSPEPVKHLSLVEIIVADEILEKML